MKRRWFFAASAVVAVGAVVAPRINLRPPIEEIVREGYRAIAQRTLDFYGSKGVEEAVDPLGGEGKEKYDSVLEYLQRQSQEGNPFENSEQEIEDLAYMATAFDRLSGIQSRNLTEEQVVEITMRCFSKRGITTERKYAAQMEETFGYRFEGVHFFPERQTGGDNYLRIQDQGVTAFIRQRERLRLTQILATAHELFHGLQPEAYEHHRLRNLSIADATAEQLAKAEFLGCFIEGEAYFQTPRLITSSPDLSPAEKNAANLISALTYFNTTFAPTLIGVGMAYYPHKNRFRLGKAKNDPAFHKEVADYVFALQRAIK